METTTQGGRIVVIAIVLVLLLLLPLHGLAQVEVETDDDDDDEVETGSSFRLHVSPPVVPESLEERREHYRAMEAKDLLRHRDMVMRRLQQQHGAASSSSSINPNINNKNDSSFELPIRSAVRIVNVGMYLVTVRIGTPATPFSMALDTGSDMTWLNCRLRRRKGKHYGLPPVEQQSKTVTTQSTDMEGEPIKVVRNWYRPALSSSWRRYRCSQKRECWDMLTKYCDCHGHNRTESCTYVHSVYDGTTSKGIFGQEKATVALSSGRMAKLPGVMLGCATVEIGGNVDTHDGILTLGHHDMSFGTIAAKRFGRRFSFCLLSAASERNSSSYLTFGPNPAVQQQQEGLMETRLVYPLLTAGYGGRVTGIRVGGELLDIPPELWDDTQLGGGVILDTSTSVTTLLPAAYTAVTEALHRRLAHLERYELDGFEFCYTWTFTGDGVDPEHNVTIPRLGIEFEGGARMEPEAANYIMPEVVPGVACQGFRAVGSGPAILGNILMQKHIWEFDLSNQKLRFRRDNCLNYQPHRYSSPSPSPSPSPSSSH